MSACDNCGKNKNQYTDYGSYLRTRGNNVDINKFIYDIGFGNFKFSNLKPVSDDMISNSNTKLPAITILDENGNMKILSPPTADGTYTLKVKVAHGKQTYSWTT